MFQQDKKKDIEPRPDASLLYAHIPSHLCRFPKDAPPIKTALVPIGDFGSLSALSTARVTPELHSQHPCTLCQIELGPPQPLLQVSSIVALRIARATLLATVQLVRLV
ncbi:MAG: hypothetical protein AAGF54_05830 [Pseudomonadota bacterium]